MSRRLQQSLPQTKAPLLSSSKPTALSQCGTGVGAESHMAQLMAWLGMQLVLALCAVLSGAQEEPFGTISQRRKSPAFLQKASKTNELLCICSVVLTTGQGDLTPLQSSQLPQPPINLPL